MRDKELIHPTWQEGFFRFPTYDGKFFVSCRRLTHITIWTVLSIVWTIP